MSRGKIQLELELQKNVPNNSKLLLAVSGGMDSVCLLHGCYRIARQKKVALEVAHIDHGLRTSSSKDALFVRKLALTYELPFHLKTLKAPRKGTNIEAWGREQRYAFFKDLTKEFQFDRILTAHTANDVAETFLMRLVSNKELRSIEFDSEDRKLLRPLLRVSRPTIESYAKKHRLKWTEDQSNSDVYFLRNRLRHEVLPLLQKRFDPRVIEVVAMRANELAKDIDALDGLAHTYSLKLATETFGSSRWLKQVKILLSELPVSFHARFAQELLTSEIGFRVGLPRAEEFLEVLKGGRLGLQFPGGKQVRRSGGRLVWIS